MKNRNGVVRGVVVAMRVAAAGAISLCLLQCSAEQSPSDAGEQDLGTVQQRTGTEHCGGVTCTGNADCTVNVPLCAQSTSSTCLVGPPRECAWKLAISSSCPCMEHDVRLCLVGGTTPGVQVCTANGARTATFWDTCQATPTCTP